MVQVSTGGDSLAYDACRSNSRTHERVQKRCFMRRVGSFSAAAPFLHHHLGHPLLEPRFGKTALVI